MGKWTSKGPGRKQCPGCEFYIGVRTRKCECGHEFAAKAKVPRRAPPKRQAASTAEATPSDPEVPKLDTRPLVITPSGACPVPLEGTDMDTVLDWVTAVREHDPGVRLHTTAVRYYVRQFYRMGTPEHATVCGFIR